MPAVDAETGQLLLSSESELFLSPDGHGGMLRALDQSGSLQDLNDRGVQQVFYCQIDNPMVQVCDILRSAFSICLDSAKRVAS